MLSNAYLLAKFRFDTAENEQHFAEICQKLTSHLDRRGDGPEGPIVHLSP